MWESLEATNLRAPRIVVLLSPAISAHKARSMTRLSEGRRTMSAPALLEVEDPSTKTFHAESMNCFQDCSCLVSATQFVSSCLSAKLGETNSTMKSAFPISVMKKDLAHVVSEAAILVSHRTCFVAIGIRIPRIAKIWSGIS